jgi:membrane-bound metal-dependent hydrolase YbcI (DUF457 family)
MFIGHFAVGLGLKRMAPRASLGALIAAANGADILWVIFLLFGWEHARIVPGITKWTPLDLYDYPWSHSLLALIVWASALALVYRAWREHKAGAAAIWIGVVSHWVLDWMTHRPDMPLYPGGPKFGLGLWNFIPWTFVVELAMFFAGVWIYARATRAHDRIGRSGFWGYVVFLLFAYVGDHFGGPPESMREIAWAGLVAVVVLLLWAWWFDMHRETVVAGQNDPAAL